MRVIGIAADSYCVESFADAYMLYSAWYAIWLKKLQKNEKNIFLYGGLSADDVGGRYSGLYACSVGIAPCVRASDSCALPVSIYFLDNFGKQPLQ